MQRKILFLAMILFFVISQNSFAQDEASLEANFPDNGETEQLKEITGEECTVYSDEENQIFFIDFENLTVNLSDIVVKDEDSKVVFKEDVFDLPVNTIYELDMKGFNKGDYQVELRSFTGVIRKTISLN